MEEQDNRKPEWQNKLRPGGGQGTSSQSKVTDQPRKDGSKGEKGRLVKQDQKEESSDEKDGRGLAGEDIKVDGTEDSKIESEQGEVDIKEGSRGQESGGGKEDVNGGKTAREGREALAGQPAANEGVSKGGESRQDDARLKRKSVLTKINEDWNNFLKDIGSASTMNPGEDQL